MREPGKTYHTSDVHGAGGTDLFDSSGTKSSRFHPLCHSRDKFYQAPSFFLPNIEKLWRTWVRGHFYNSPSNLLVDHERPEDDVTVKVRLNGSTGSPAFFLRRHSDFAKASSLMASFANSEGGEVTGGRDFCLEAGPEGDLGFRRWRLGILNLFICLGWGNSFRCHGDICCWSWILVCVVRGVVTTGKWVGLRWGEEWSGRELAVTG